MGNVSKKVDLLAAAMILRKAPTTAVELADKLRCSKSHAHAVITKLRKRVTVVRDEVRAGKRGPMATTYRLRAKDFERFAARVDC